jgi:hypothetical protein
MVTRQRLKRLFVIGALGAAVALAAAPVAPSGAGKAHPSVRGAGTTMLEGGTGSPSFTPVLTKVAFYWRAGAGRFECLALAPSSEAGESGSGDFDTNIMYVTGPITSAELKAHTVVLKGTATVTGVGAGSHQPFTATLTRGGPGATLVLEVSGLTFREILLAGRFKF